MAELKRKRKTSVPLIGRDGVMRSVKATVGALVSAHCSGHVENAVGFITFEGGSGIGKTRCLKEVREQVRLSCTPADHQLKSLYNSGAVHEIFVTFNGRKGSESSDHSHLPRDIVMDGSKFLEVTILSELLHGMSFFKLDSATQASVSSSASFRDAMAKVSELLKRGKSGVVLLYLLLDEMQLLAAHLGARGQLFLKEMYDAAGRFMRDSCEQAGDLILVPCLAGCRVPGFGNFGACKFLRNAHRLTGLSLEESRQVVEPGVRSSTVMEHEQFGVLLQDCLGVPRFLEWISAGLMTGAADLTDLEMIDVARCSMVMSMKSWAVGAVEFGGSNLERLKDAFRYCLVQESVEDSEVAVEESTRGYFYGKEEAGKLVFQAPNVLLHHLGVSLKLHQPLVELRPELVQDEVMERACLEMVYVRLCLARRKTVRLDELFPGGACISPFQVQIPEKVSRKDEEFQFIRSGPSGELHFSRKDDASTRLVAGGCRAPGRTALLPLHGVVMKTKGPFSMVDGRLFLRGRNVEDGEGEALGTLELWIQCKGGQRTTTVADMRKWCDEAFDAALVLPGRRKVYVILVPYHSFDSEQLDEFFLEQHEQGRQVLVVDGAGCEVFMPGFFSRCVKR